MATEDFRLSIVREKLLKDNIKLWLPPYTNENGSLGIYPEELVERYCTELQYSKDDVIHLLEHLRKHSVENLIARTKFRETGLASLRIKLANAKNKNSHFQNSVIEISLTNTGQQLKELIAKNMNVNVSCLKLIAVGRVIKEDKALSEQNLKPNSQVMALLVENNIEQLIQNDQEAALLQRIKDDAEFLSIIDAANPDNDQYLQVADQSGRVLNLPFEERKALSFAMALNEKGRAALKKKEYAKALVFLLEADREFQQCTSEILNAVDNYALLCLDIAWCYLCLNSVNQLPDAVSRLKKCEECFHRSYGENLERLVILKKGLTGNEAALFTRLHLLQGIVAYHRNEKDLARTLLNRAAAELSDLKVDDKKLSEVVALGYSPSEARVALRGCKGNLEQAVQYILKRKEELAEIHQKEKEERKYKKRQKELGKTVNGEWLNVCIYDQFCSMGYPPKKVKEALKQANNNASLTVDILQQNQDFLNFSDTTDASEENVAKIVSLGFQIDAARNALESLSNNVEGAISHLIKEMSSSNTSNITREQESQARAAADRLAEDISNYEEDHLDFTLEEEENFLKEYLTLMDSNITK
ncbi:NEDD8 ultimate buster 1-like [Centruroides vittatus]|uniref:NEDD8 ultimate buster 1-like n=1 Tax=Centruroides vittatus TaxID=120091 RepID=UPI003510532F